MPEQQLVENTLQKRFIEFLIKYGDLDKAAKACRITPQQAKALTRRKDYARHFIDCYRQIFISEIAPTAILVIKDMLSGRLKTDKVKADLAKTILDRIGLSTIKADEPKDKNPDVEGMTVQELETHLDKLKREAADKAITIDAPHITLDNVEYLDYID